jgi:hypothetical protein
MHRTSSKNIAGSAGSFKQWQLIIITILYCAYFIAEESRLLLTINIIFN